MEKQKNSQMLVIVVLSVVLLTMSVGFAAFSQNLSIDGNVTVKSASWNVAFDTGSYSETTGTGAVTVSTTNRTITATSMTYNVTLNKPGDFYEFSINVKNTGTFDAKLTGLTMTALTTEQAKYLTYTVTYGGNSYTSSQTGLNAILANTTGVETVKVRVEYVQPDNAADLPNTEQHLTLNATLEYVQA